MNANKRKILEDAGILYPYDNPPMPLPELSKGELAMRKKDRIRPFCEQLADAWEKCPDMRFGQFICNVYATELKRDPFYIEDDESMRLIEKFANELSPYYKPPKEET